MNFFKWLFGSECCHHRCKSHKTSIECMYCGEAHHEICMAAWI